MPQPPLKVDALQIEPGSGDSLFIERDSATGSLKFTDSVVTGGILLNQLAGIQSIGNVFTVGKTGAGSQFTTIQSALDNIPTTSSVDNPYLILVAPGEYKETVNIIRDGVILYGLGKVILRSALEDIPNAVGNDHTLILSSQLGTTPENFEMYNFLVSNSHNTKSCIRISGGPGSTVGQGKITFHNCDLQALAPGGNRSLWATSVNNIIANYGDWAGNNQSLLFIEEISHLKLKNISMGAASLRYDITNDQPANSPVQFSLENCTVGSGTSLSPALSIDLDGNSSAILKFTEIDGNVTFSGDQSVEINTCNMTGNLIALETIQVFSNSNFLENGSINTNPTAIFDVPSLRGVENFSSSSISNVTFKVPLENDNYQVILTLDDQPANDETPWITNKLNTGFTINFSIAQTLNVNWTALRRFII